MTKYQIEWSEQKNPDWKVISLKDPSGVMSENVSVNRKNKDGEEFPNFDAIIVGAEVEGNLWESQAGKKYLFAPKPAPTGTVRRGGGIQAAVERKEKSISAFQENKEESIKISSTMRDAVLLTIAQGITGLDEDVIQTKIERWREYLWHSWSDPEKYPPFPNK